MKEVLEADEVLDGAKKGDDVEGKECFYVDPHLISFD